MKPEYTFSARTSVTAGTQVSGLPWLHGFLSYFKNTNVAAIPTYDGKAPEAVRLGLITLTIVTYIPDQDKPVDWYKLTDLGITARDLMFRIPATERQQLNPNLIGGEVHIIESKLYDALGCLDSSEGITLEAKEELSKFLVQNAKGVRADQLEMDYITPGIDILRKYGIVSINGTVTCSKFLVKLTPLGLLYRDYLSED